MLRDGPLGVGAASCGWTTRGRRRRWSGFVPCRRCARGMAADPAAADDDGRRVPARPRRRPGPGPDGAVRRVVNNADRKGGHVLTAGDGHIYGHRPWHVLPRRGQAAHGAVGVGRAAAPTDATLDRARELRAASKANSADGCASTHRRRGRRAAPRVTASSRPVIPGPAAGWPAMPWPPSEDPAPGAPAGAPVGAAPLGSCHGVLVRTAAVPSVPGAARSRCTTPPGRAVRPGTRRTRARDDVRLRHHPVRRHPPRPRGHYARLRPGQPDLARRRTRRARTCRTSPTSTIRCWSAPTRDGEDWMVLGNARDRAVPRGHGGAAGAAARRTTSAPSSRSRRSSTRSRSCSTRGAAYRLDDGTGDVYFRHDASAAVRLRVQATTTRRCCALSAERGGDPDRAGKRDPLDPLLWRGARDGEPAWDGGRSGRAGPAGTSSARSIALDRLGAVSTCRAAATT